MDGESLYEKLKDFIAVIAWRVYLWARNTTQEKFEKDMEDEYTKDGIE